MPIRDAVEADLPAILAITNDAVRTTTAVWNETPTTLEARAAWLRDRQAQVPEAPANMLFPEWAAGKHEKLEAAGAVYYRFPAPEGRERARLVASWSTTEADVDAFLNAF